MFNDWRSRSVPSLFSEKYCFHASWHHVMWERPPLAVLRSRIGKPMASTGASEQTREKTGGNSGEKIESSTNEPHVSPGPSRQRGWEEGVAADELLLTAWMSTQMSTLPRTMTNFDVIKETQKKPASPLKFLQQMFLGTVEADTIALVFQETGENTNATVWTAFTQ